ncbi:COX15/CtaA family protein [Microbacterium album]|uniref:Protein required for cytochrome oxidase assembly n=1 Tax=Microbacterium album TaxID=2053191 RepID=A0A917IC93_9MICO|nr:COX15/CtaA family protein [Microbacterium album]GGH34792.1 protein required for cytochrome oxidase assembly [Microbacterium album]
MSVDTAAPPAAPSGPGRRFWDRLPESVDRRIRVFAWLSFIAEVTIIATGGAVRLTGSGLGCSEWPLCTPDSLVPTEDMGIHGVIEFGNRTMTGVVGLLALAVLVLVLRIRAERRDLFVLASVVVGGVVAQAIVGGITVWTGLNPFVVGFHYTASLLLVCVTAAFLVRAYDRPGPRTRAVPTWFAVLTHITTLALAATIFFGVLTTGNGPHSGDANVVRDGFDATLLAHIHAWPGYILLGLVLVMLIAAWALHLPPRRWLIALLAALAVQVFVGVWQAREGLPELLVGIHMVLAALSAAAFTVVVLRLKRPVSGS